jgi:ComF family protein
LSFLSNFFTLLYPESCPICSKALLAGEKIICTFCLYKLPKTNFHLSEQNPIHDLFIGRIDIKHSGAYLNFRKGGGVQQLIHEFKYKSRVEIGRFLGECYGIDLMEAPWIKTVDCVIPIPLHEKKLKKRGFNQSEEFASGIAKILEIPMRLDVLERATFSETQTKKSKYQRWENVKGVFEIKNPDLFTGNHVLLVDDVITTGATMEAATQCLIEDAGAQVSVAAMAFTAI